MKSHEQQSQRGEDPGQNIGSQLFPWTGVKDQAPEDTERTKQIEEAKKKGSGAL